MKKTELIHTRIEPQIKKECDKIFHELGMTTSFAVTLFLNQVVLHKGLPFDVSIPSQDINETISFAEGINSIDGGKASNKTKDLISLYLQGKIDYETMQFAIGRQHK